MRTRHAGRSVSPARNAQDYAPKVFVRAPEAKEAKLGIKHFGGAMDRLIDTGRIRIEAEAGDNRHRRKVLVPARLTEDDDLHR
jgi:hypothetical protein